MRFCLRTLLILLAVGPLLIAGRVAVGHAANHGCQAPNCRC